MNHGSVISNHKRTYYRQLERQNRRPAFRQPKSFRKDLWIAIAAQFTLHVAWIITFCYLSSYIPGKPEEIWIMRMLILSLYLILALFDLGVTILLYYILPQYMLKISLVILFSLIVPIATKFTGLV